MTDRIADVWGTRTPHAAGSAWPVRVDEYVEDGIAAAEVDWVRSACVLCSNGCGMDIGVHSGRIVGVRGRAADRVNHGRLGPKGLFGWQANNSPDRLTEPLVRRNGRLQPATWDDALDLVVDRSRQVLTENGPLAMGFYNSGQLFLEDYYTLALVVRGGIGTPHLDGNTRLCTATSDFALKETFGTDGAPGSLTDFDECDTIFAVGHNIPETHTVLWARILDRLHGPDRPRLVVVDPRRTRIAREADVHLPIRSGTNLALLNGIQHELIANGWIDRSFVDAHTVGFDELTQTVADYPPDRVAEICGVPADDIRAAARIIGTGRRLVSTALQGVYQSHQATASACQVNNITLLRGMIGRPGCTVFQMNGQPTAQNTRETGADGDFVGMRNWQNPDHVAELARIWNLNPLQLPSWAPPTHVMQMFRHVHQPRPHGPSVGEGSGSAGPGPAGHGRLPRVRAAARADRQGRRPAGEVAHARGVLRRVRRQHPGPTVRLLRTDLREAAVRQRRAVAVHRCAAGGYGAALHRPQLQHRHGLLRGLWPRPGHRCQLRAKGPRRPQPGRARDPQGREVPPAARVSRRGVPVLVHHRAHGVPLPYPDQDRPRPQLAAAAPEIWIEMAEGDAERLGIGEGDLVRVESPRGRLEAKARITGIREGMVFAPFHYGYWDHRGGDGEPSAGPDGLPTAANELTITDWDPVSKQPLVKLAAVQVTKLAASDGRPAAAPTTTSSDPVAPGVPATVGGGGVREMVEEEA